MYFYLSIYVLSIIAFVEFVLKQINIYHKLPKEIEDKYPSFIRTDKNRWKQNRIVLYLSKFRFYQIWISCDYALAISHNFLYLLDCHLLSWTVHPLNWSQAGHPTQRPASKVGPWMDENTKQDADGHFWIL